MSDLRADPKTSRKPKLIQPTQLPLWSDRVRGLPNPLARSALFTVGSCTEPRFFAKQHRTIQTLAGWVMTVRGEELRQDDEDTFLQLVHLARTQPIENGVEFSAYSLLKEMGWSKNGASYARLKATLDRLQGTSLRIASEAGGFKGYQGGLVRKFTWKSPDSEEPLTRWRVWLEPEIVSLFGPTQYTQLWWDQRLRLKSNLSKYLHSYFASHEAPYAMKVTTIRALSGSRTARLTDFRKLLRTALDELVRESFLDSWEIAKGDLVHVVRSPKSHYPRDAHLPSPELISS